MFEAPEAWVRFRAATPHRPSTVDDRNLREVIGTDGVGRPLTFPDPGTGWVERVSSGSRSALAGEHPAGHGAAGAVGRAVGGGPGAVAGGSRGGADEIDACLAALATWFGEPTVAAPRTTSGQSCADDLVRAIASTRSYVEPVDHGCGTHPGSPGSTEDSPENAFAEVKRLLVASGAGGAALVLVGVVGGADSRAFLAVNHADRLWWLDPAVGSAGADPPPTVRGGAGHVEVAVHLPCGTLADARSRDAERGLREVLGVDTTGHPPRFPDPGTGWAERIAPSRWATPVRGTVTDARREDDLAAVVATLATWHGQPTVAASSSTDPVAVARRRFVRGLFGEAVPPPPRGDGADVGEALATITDFVRGLGHGGTALILSGSSSSSGAHVVVALQHAGRVWWIDPRDTTARREQPPSGVTSAGDLRAVAMGRDGKVIRPEQVQPDETAAQSAGPTPNGPTSGQPTPSQSTPSQPTPGQPAGPVLAASREPTPIEQTPTDVREEVPVEPRGRGPAHAEAACLQPEVRAGAVPPPAGGSRPTILDLGSDLPGARPSAEADGPTALLDIDGAGPADGERSGPALESNGHETPPPTPDEDYDADEPLLWAPDGEGIVLSDGMRVPAYGWVVAGHVMAHLASGIVLSPATGQLDASPTAARELGIHSGRRLDAGDVVRVLTATDPCPPIPVDDVPAWTGGYWAGNFLVARREMTPEQRESLAELGRIPLTTVADGDSFFHALLGTAFAGVIRSEPMGEVTHPAAPDLRESYAAAFEARRGEVADGICDASWEHGADWVRQGRAVTELTDLYPYLTRYVPGLHVVAIGQDGRLYAFGDTELPGLVVVHAGGAYCATAPAAAVGPTPAPDPPSTATSPARARRRGFRR